MKFRNLISLTVATTSIAITSAMSSVQADTITKNSFSGRTEFGLGENCSLSYNPDVCAINGQGLLSGTIIYDPSETPIYPNTKTSPIFFEARFSGLVNSLPSQPNYIDVTFTTDSVTDFFLSPGYPYPVPVVRASIVDPSRPEFQNIDLFRQGKAPNSPSIFQLSTSLPGGGSRLLSEGVLEFSEPQVSVPEPSSLFGLGVVLGIGVLSAQRKKIS